MSHSTISLTFLSAFIFFNMGRFWYFFRVSPYNMYINLLIPLLFRHITKIIIKVNSIFYPQNGQSTMSQYQGMHVFMQKKATNNHKEFIFLGLSSSNDVQICINIIYFYITFIFFLLGLNLGVSHDFHILISQP